MSLNALQSLYHPTCDELVTSLTFTQLVVDW